MTSDTSDKPKEGRFVRHSRVMRRLASEPSFAVPLLRGWFVTLWATKGGGFYGLGYIVTLIALEVVSAQQGIGSGATSYVAGQAIQYVVGFGIDSIFNTVRAFVWPFYLFQWLGLPGIAVFVGGGIVFERFVRPSVEGWFPELAAAREKKLQAKQAKRERKLAAREARRARRQT